MINLYDPRSYTRVFEFEDISVDDEIVFAVPNGRRWRPVKGMIVAMFQNRLDSVDHWVRIRKFDDGGEEDFRLADMVFEEEVNLVEDKPSLYFAPAPGFTKEEVTLPKYQTNGAAAFDFAAAEDKYIPSGAAVWTISTGLMMEIPEGWECQIRPRSGFTKQTTLEVANSPGTIDSDYRGEVKIMIRNVGNSPYQIKKGERIAQGKMALAPQFALQWKDELSETDRGTGGFGSTG